uniref:Uncharacterized protein n=1 Tax=Tetranychus urticae TaxID=32264 RepID=T1JWQ9_TETUR
MDALYKLEHQHQREKLLGVEQ